MLIYYVKKTNYWNIIYTLVSVRSSGRNSELLYEWANGTFTILFYKY